MPRIFDIESARDLFDLVERRFADYCDDPEKATEDLIFIIMIVNHLREWIAPKIKNQTLRSGRDDTPEARFSRCVYENPHFAVIRELCNGTKHANRELLTNTEYETNVLAWKDIFEVKDIFTGVPTGHFVDGHRIEVHLKPIMDMYRKWFAEHPT